jgi:hypothetical protein
MKCPTIDYPASCEICAVVRFLRAKNMSAADIHHELCAAVYSQNIMSQGNVRQWCRMFKMGEQMFTMKNDVVDRPSLVSSKC